MPGGFKVLVMTDLEGVACAMKLDVWDPRDAAAAFAEYTKILAAEANAAAAAAFDAGAEEVLLVEGHANSFRGHLEDFDPRAGIAMGVPAYELAERRYDALLLVGYHAMADVEKGILSHSHSNKTYVSTWLNGTLVGEIGHLAALFGDCGTPLVFASGEAAACREAEDLVDGVVTASVKEAIHRFGGISLSPKAAADLIRRRAREAVEKREEIAPLRFDPPIEFVVEFSTTDPVERNTLVPGIEAAGPRSMIIRGESVTQVMKLFNLTARIV